MEQISFTGGVNVLFEDNTGIIDFYPSEHTGVIYVSEADLVSGAMYKRKMAKLRMVCMLSKHSSLIDWDIDVMIWVTHSVHHMHVPSLLV